MSRFYIFVIRAVLGVVFAVFLTRFFYGSIEPLYVAGLAVFMLGLAYILEYWKLKKQLEEKKGEPGP